MSTLIAAPMHGEVKLRREGLRTRDGHFLEWFSRLRPALVIDVYSRPEPWPRLTAARWRGSDLPSSWRLKSPQPLTIPRWRERRRWWVTSGRYDEVWGDADAAIVWNPVSGARNLRSVPTSSVAAFDLLDDWLAHDAFRPIWNEVESSYRYLFARCDVVTANSEATAALADRFGRTDVQLIRNGCDPHRFTPTVSRHRDFTVGYGGKIGHRLDVDLIASVASAFPEWRFEFLGPILVRGVARRLRAISNVYLAGDVHYEHYPSRMATWDVAWVPHRLGSGEVGGDVIKLYEYRAAGLPVISTKIIGWHRALPGVRPVDPDRIVPALAEVAGSAVPGTIPRDAYETPAEDTWEYKAGLYLELLGL